LAVYESVPDGIAADGEKYKLFVKDGIKLKK
jgi:hypothetical protein